MDCSDLRPACCAACGSVSCSSRHVATEEGELLCLMVVNRMEPKEKLFLLRGNSVTNTDEP